VDAAALAALEHANWIDYVAASVSLGPKGLLVRDRGIVTALGHVPMRFYNQILVEEPHAVAEAIGDAVACGRERRDQFVVSLRDGFDDRFAPQMAELGLVASDDSVTSAMALHPIGDAAPSTDLDPGFEIRRVTDETGLEDHRRTVTAGFDAHPSVAEAMIGIGLLGRPECAVYVGYLNGLPVTAGLGWRTGQTIGVYNIATIPTARRHGFGAVMTARVVADGKAAGCDVGALQASSMGRPIYQRMGFRMALRYFGYVEPLNAA
jgi:GNAT superfamily N-acetyltransferase